jgi:hypothetical protein
MHFTSVERVIAFVALVPGTFNYLRRRLFHPSQDSDRARVEEEISASRNCHEPSHAIVVESYKDLQSHLVSAALSADNFPALQTPKSRISTARKRTCMSLERITADTHTIHTHTSYIYKVPEFLLPLSPIGNRAGSNLAILVKRAPPSFAASPPSRTYIQKKSVTLCSNPPRVFQQPNRTQPFHNASQTNHCKYHTSRTRSTPHREKRHPTNAVGSNAPTDQRARGE